MMRCCDGGPDSSERRAVGNTALRLLLLGDSRVARKLTKSGVKHRGNYSGRAVLRRILQALNLTGVD